jgi:hypothetical protein
MVEEERGREKMVGEGGRKGNVVDGKRGEGEDCERGG